MNPHEPRTPDQHALDAVADLTAATFDVLTAWPIDSTDPRTHRLAHLLDVHGPFTPLSVLLGWIATELRARLADEPATAAALAAGSDPEHAATWRLYYRAPGRSMPMLDVIARLLGYVVDGSADALAHLHDAAAMLHGNGPETARVLIAALDLAVAVREDRVAVVPRFAEPGEDA